ncbi:MAG: hypothetical protein GWP04_00825 [Gammaproteobacteria bacterium]|nr:hypothetical protein [Gammaproteobacteria bacterium]
MMRGTRESIRWGVLFVAVACGGYILLFLWDNWFVNYDGGAYLALAKSLRTGHGYRFPDGSFATFRGPLYPLVIAGGWLVLPVTAKMAMWVTRSLLILNALLTCGLACRFTRRWLPAAAAGIFVIVQPLPLVSGGLFFVPDVLAVSFVLAAILVLPTDGHGRGARWLLVGMLLGLAFLSKETMGLALLLPVLIVAGTRGIRHAARVTPEIILGWVVPVGLWSMVSLRYAGVLPTGLGGFAGWSAYGLLAGIVIGSTVGTIVGRRHDVEVTSTRSVQLPWLGLLLVGTIWLLAVAVPLIRPLGEVGIALRNDLDRWLYRGTARTALLAAVVPTLAWGLWRRKRRDVFIVLSMVSLGLALIVHSSLAGLGPRNGVLLAYGVALLVALWAHDTWNLQTMRWLWRPLVVVVSLVFISVNVVAGFKTNDRLDARGLTWDAPAVSASAAWLGSQSDDVVSTPAFSSFMSVLAARSLQMELAPVFTQDRSASTHITLRFNKRAWWAGSVPAHPDEEDRPVAISVARRTVSAFYGQSLNAAANEGTLLVVTGNFASIASALDGGVILPYLEAQPNAHRVYQSSLENLPQWVVIYEIDGPLEADATPPLVHMAVDAPVPSLAPDQIVMDNHEYENMILEVLGEPLETELHP